jgi:hypothetical protein
MVLEDILATPQLDGKDIVLTVVRFALPFRLISFSIQCFCEYVLRR